ncbi:MAG: HEAT repeat domain-containing protein [Anaerolineales bacterium]|nr:HEAT repeat domain-containing protein [Anaerolineales bacterium]
MSILQNHLSTDDMLCDAAKQLIELGDKDAFGLLYKRLTTFNDSSWVRREIVLALGCIMILNDLESPKANQLMIKILLSPEEEIVKAAAIICLGQIGEKQAVEPLINILDSGEDGLLFVTISALGEIGDPSAIDYLIKYLDADSLLIPQTAAKGLGKFGAAAKKALPALIDLAERGNEAERREANTAIEAIKEKINLNIKT